MTRHWVEAYIDHDHVDFELICEHPNDCQETSAPRSDGCCVKDFFDDIGTDLFEFFPRGNKDPFGRVEVKVSWRGNGEDAELSLTRPDSTPAEPCDSDGASAGEPNWQRIATQVARYGGSYHGLTTVERDAVETEVKGIQEQEWGTDWERRTDASDGGQHA